MADASDNTGHVKASMLAGVRWVAGARMVSEVLLLASSVALARLIAPAEFGRAVIALIIASVASVLATHAFASLLIQQKEIAEEDVRSAVALNLAIGAVLSAAVFLLAAPLSALTSQHQADLIRAISPTCLLAGINAIPSAMLQRRLDFRRLSMIDVAALLSQVVTSVGLAVAGVGAAAIVAGALVAQLVATTLSLLAYRPPFPRVHLEALRRLMSFGAPTALSNLAFTASQNVDYAVIGARLNPTQLAFYFRAFQYGVEYQSKISRILVDMAFPVYSRLADHDEIRAVRSRMVRIHAAVIFPLLAGYAALAPTLIPWLLGQRWEPVVTPSQYLTVAGAVSTVMTGTGALLVAVGRPGRLLAWNVGFIACYGSVIYLVAPHGVVTVSATVAVFYVTQAIAAHWFLLSRTVGIPLRDLGQELLGPCCACAALVACAASLRALLTDVGAPSMVTLIVAGSAGLVAYLLCLRYLFPGIWADLTLLFERLLRRAAPRGARGRDAAMANVSS